ncbi:MAG: site-specific DNA-methyltransferase [Sphingomonas sp.]|nr:site-specific DNA-methyltransferase [Sphingomonas sp.]
MSVTIHVGDCIAELRKLPSDSIDCCVTSPPYWGLRDYGVAGQMGLEPTLGEHIAAMVAVFEEVRRVLKPTGSLWLNYGDCYATAPNGRSAADTKAAATDDRTFRDKPFSTVGPVYRPDDSPRNKSRQGRPGNLGNGGVNGAGLANGRIEAGGYLKPKDLCMVPNRLAIALQDAGWWVRSEIVWGKPNAMPDSSGVYRPSAAHEKIFLLTKSGDGDVWRARDTGALSLAPDLTERCPLVTIPKGTLTARWVRLGSWYDAEAVRMPVSDATHARCAQDVANQHGSDRANGGGKTNGPMRAVGQVVNHGERAKRALSAKMVDQPPRRLLRNYESDLSPIVPPEVWEIATSAFSDAHFATFPPALVAPCVMAGCPVGGTVLDPFGGAGTTGLVADRLGRDAILIELNPEYAEMARERLRAGMARVAGERRAPAPIGGLFGSEAAA